MLRLQLEELERREVLNAAAFPATTNGIYVLSDQLNNSLSEAMVQFIASHYVGTQKMTPSENARYVAQNASWVLLDYRLGTTAGPADFINGGQWGSDWSTVNAHEDWFMHNASGERLHNSTWDWYQMDVTNSEWRQYWLSSVIANLRTDGAQAVFADGFTAGIGGFWYDQYDERFAGTNAANPAAWSDGVTWLDRLNDFAGYVESGLGGTPEQFSFIPNLDAMVTGWANPDTSQLDGAFLEGFGEWGPAYLHGSASDWTLSMNRALAMSSAGKIVIMQPSLLGTPDSATGQLQRGFDLGTDLLLQGEHTYLNMLAPGGSATGAYYYPEYSIDIGPAVTPTATAVSQYAWQGVYRRDFQNGLVLVNPTNASVTIDLGQTYERVTGSGGGALTASSLDASGNYIGGSLTQTAVTSVTLPPGSAAILLTPVPDILPIGGGFETPSVGTGTYGAFQYDPTGSPWTFDSGSGVAGNGSGFTDGNPDAPDGTQVAFLQSYGTISQTVTFAAGTYSLSFLAAQRGNYQYSSQTFQVLIDGNVVGTFTPDGTSYAAYTTDSFTVTAGAHTIQFVGLDPDGQDNTAFLDQGLLLR
jgi:hypothetical protein